VPDSGDYNDGEIGEMMIGRGNQSARRRLDKCPFCPTQTTYAARKNKIKKLKT
jgi:hypothetical protein